MNTYNRIKDLCDRKGLSIRALNNELGFGNGTISKWKNAKPTSDKLSKVADYFGVSVEYLINGSEKEQYYFSEETAEMAQKLFEHQELRLLFNSAKDASPDDLKVVHDMLLALKRKENND